MAENTKQINARISQKHDIEANWLKAQGFTPKAGEIIIYDAEKEGDKLPKDIDPINQTRDTRISYPRIKVGDGETNVNNLPFAKETDLELIEDRLLDEGSTDKNKTISATTDYNEEGIPLSVLLKAYTGATDSAAEIKLSHSGIGTG
jgi:hypothetical protein